VTNVATPIASSETGPFFEVSFELFELGRESIRVDSDARFDCRSYGSCCIGAVATGTSFAIDREEARHLNVGLNEDDVQHVT
jgi:hypothetical protein